MTLSQVQYRLVKAINILKSKGIETITLFSIERDNNRKPRIGMWKHVLKLLDHSSLYLDNPDIEIINRDYFYVGDAAGRNGDFAPTDLFFARNCRIKFMTPEEFGVTYKLKSDIYPIHKWYKKHITTGVTPNITKRQLIDNFNHNKHQQYLILMVGFPGSTKSTVAKELAAKYNYIVLSMDDVKSPSAFNRKLSYTLGQGSSIIIDNCNAKDAIRIKYINKAKLINPNISTKIIWICTSKAMSYHLNNVRSTMVNTSIIPMVAYHRHAKSFVTPTSREVDELIKVDFDPEFSSAKEKVEFLREY